MKRIIPFILMTLIAAAAFSGCAQPAGPDASDTAATKVTIVLDWTPNTNHTGIYVAKEKGYFTEQGLDVDIQQPPEDGALSLLAAGKAQFAVSFQEEIAAAITADKPLDVVAVAALIQHNDSGIISLKSKGITGPAKMENMRYATWNSPVELAILKHVVTIDGGDFSKVQLIPEYVENIVAALNTKIDCVWVYYPQEGIHAQNEGLDIQYFAFKDLDPVLDFYTPVLASNGSFLKANPETAKNFLAATAKGYKYAIENPADAAKILTDAVPGMDEKTVLDGQEWLKDQYMAEVAQWGYIDPARWDRFYAWLYENKALAVQIPAGAGFTNEYLPE